ncbi:hypothetical protein [Luteolibacter sp. LG18]|uniref:hypothetical protein n=1 Tax=Luteolibacter sp. LG18 TaxID=2819286 RepID=UPI002B2DAC77|nr:hypothetical protein llg_17000 [Luteolibacter sp. LG18]
MVPLLFSCENATCAIPEAWRDLFRGSEEIVASTEGWEPGALNLAQGFAMKFRTPLVYGDVTRLLIDLDAAGDARWSRFSSQLTDAQHTKLVERHETKHHDMLVAQITEAIRRDPQVVHVMIHTTPDEDAVVALEAHEDDASGTAWATAWSSAIRKADEPLRVETRSVPVMPAGAASLRLFFGSAAYAAIVLRVSQSFFLENRPWRWEKLKKHLIDTLVATARELTVSQESPSSPGC